MAGTAAEAAVEAVVVGVADAAATDRAGDDIRREQLPSGVRVVTESMDSVRSVAIGCWVAVGARDEPAELAGASHFLEHLLFKGTEHRSARAIADQVDGLGGELNAFTSKEYTAYYLRVPASSFAWGVELLGELLSVPTLRADDVEAERQVILEELLMSLDDPDDRVHTLLFEALFPDHPVGREVLGDATTVGEMGRDAIAGFHAEHYGPANLVVAVAGHVAYDDVLSAVDEGFPGASGSARPERLAPETPPVPLVVESRPLEQAHVAVGWRALDLRDPDRYALAVANQVLGGGVSSRLFQEVREERGLCYAIATSPAALSDCGALTLSVGTAPDRLDETAAVVADVVETFAEGGITDQELQVAQGFLTGSLLLSLEDSGSRMSRLGSGEAVRGEVVPVDEQVRRIEAVGRDDVARVAARVLRGPRTVAAVGPFSDDHPALARLTG